MLHMRWAGIGRFRPGLPRAGGLYGPGGRYEHMPLSLVTVQVVDVEDRTGQGST